MPLSRLTVAEPPPLSSPTAPADAARATPRSLRHRLAPFALAALFVAWWLFSIGLRPLSLPDEGRYAGVARDMVVHGDWLVPRIDGLPFFHKPPLFYWLDALAMQLFGIGPAAARSASVLGALLACAVVAAHARRVAGAGLARAALLALALQPLFFLAGQYANLDMLVAGLHHRGGAGLGARAGAGRPRHGWHRAGRRSPRRRGWRRRNRPHRDRDAAPRPGRRTRHGRRSPRGRRPPPRRPAAASPCAPAGPPPASACWPRA
jgi:hypothetical protein